jgi:biotin carboxyl carrier protein
VLQTFVVRGRARRVLLQRRGPSAWLIAVDGIGYHVDVAELGPDSFSLLLGGDGGGGRSVSTVVVPGKEPGELHVAVDGRNVPVWVVESERSRKRGAGGADHAGPQRVVAPMPGKVVRVLVAPGQRVEPRQGLVVVEAMKMENELRAPSGGVITRVGVEPGASVEAGAVLIVIE